MDEVLKEALLKAMELAEKTGQFVMDQAPELLREFYMWHITTSILWIVFSISLYLLGRYLPKIFLRKCDDIQNYDIVFFGYVYDDESVTVFAWILYALASIAGIATMICNIYTLVFILVAPKLYLIEYFMQ